MVVAYWMLVLANGVAFGTLAAGWYAVPVVALIGAWAAPHRSVPLISVPLGCMLGWGCLLLRSARADGFSALLDILARLLPVKPPVLIAASLGLALLFGLSSALVAAGLRKPGGDPAASRGEAIS